MQVIIDFNNIYPIKYISNERTEMKFDAPQKNGRIVEIIVRLTKHPDPLIPDVYNLGFGPADKKGNILDNVKLHHADIDKVFSTIIMASFVFLYPNNHFAIGIDGSDDQRARLYHRMFKHNQAYLKDYVVAFGLDWFVRILRNGKFESFEDGAPFPKPKTESFDYNRENRDLYRYYMFRLL